MRISKIIFPLVLFVISNLQAVEEQTISPSFPYDMFFEKLDKIFPAEQERGSSSWSSQSMDVFAAKESRRYKKEDIEKSESFYYLIILNSILQGQSTEKQKTFVVEYVDRLTSVVRQISKNTFKNEKDKEIFLDFMAQIIHWSTLVKDNANHKDELISLAQMAFEKMKLIDSKATYTRLNAIMEKHKFFNPLKVLPDSAEVKAAFFDGALSNNLLQATGKTFVDSVERAIELLDEDPAKNKGLLSPLVERFQKDADFKLINEVFPLEEMATEVAEGSAAMLVTLAHFHPFFPQIIAKHMMRSIHGPKTIRALDPSNIYVRQNKESDDMSAAYEKQLQDMKVDHERKMQELEYEQKNAFQKAAHNIKTQAVLSGNVIYSLYNALRLYAASWVPEAKSTSRETSDKRISEERKKILDFLADYLTLKHLSLDGALSEMRSIHLAKTDVFSINDTEMDVLSARIKKNFSWGLIQEISDKFDARGWKGHIKTDKAFTDDEARVYTFGKAVDKTLTYNDFAYSYNEMRSEESPKAIVIEIYGGHTKGKCSSSNDATSFNTPAIFLKLKHLGDCDQDVFQSRQLLEQNFAKTHVLFLKRMSDFIKKYKEENPKMRDLPVFLKGTSFGGFFVTSYGLLQSTVFGKQSFESIYKGWAATDLKSAFPTEGDVSIVHGVISSEGAIDSIMKIANPDALSQFAVPIYVSQNVDDDRVKWNDVFPIIKLLPKSMLWAAFNRRGALDFGAELDEGLAKERYGSIGSTTRGHGDGAMEDLPNFIAHSVQKSSRSKFGVEQQRIRMRDYEGVGKKEHRDVEQFLANLQLTQRTIEARKKPISKAEELDLGLHGIEHDPLAKQEKYDELMQVVTKRSLWQSMKKGVVVSKHKAASQ